MDKNIFQNKQDSYRKILKLILTKQRISRKEICNELNLAWGTVSNNIISMIDEKIIKEEIPIINGVGRSTCYLVPNGEVYAAIGVDINTIGISASLILLNGETKFYTTLPVEELTQKQILSKTFEILDRVFSYNGGRYKIISIGLSCQGDVYSHLGVFNKMPFVNDWEPINLVEIIEKKYDVSTFQSHDMECLLHDIKFRYPNDNNLIVSRVVDGIGFGMIKDGVVINESISLDYGHEIIERNGIECECGQKGCLEAYSSIKGITKRLGISEEELYENYAKYSDILDEAIDKYSYSLLNIASIFNIKKVIVCGKLFEKIPDLFSDLEYKISMIDKRKDFDIDLMYSFDLSPSFGAAFYSFKKLFE